jgi:hypothetical protein
VPPSTLFAPCRLAEFPEGLDHFVSDDPHRCFYRSHHQRSESGRSPCLSRLNFRTFRFQPPYCHFATLGLTRPVFVHRRGCRKDLRIAPPPGVEARLGLPAVKGSRFASTLPDRLGRIEFTIRLRTVHSPQVALHISSRKCSYHFRLQGGNVTLDGTCTRLFNRLHRRTSYARQSVVRRLATAATRKNEDVIS